MDLNPVKKAKIANSSVSESSENADGLNSGHKMIAKLNHDCLAQVLMHIPILDRLETENVCQKWREATGLSWYKVKKLNFDDFMLRLDEKEEIFEKIMWRCCRCLTHLTIDEYYSCMADVLKDNCHRMIHLDVNVGDECKGLLEMIESMSQLKYFKVSIGNLGSWGCILFERILNELPRAIEEIHLIQSKYYHPLADVPLDKFNNLRCLTLVGMSLTDANLGSIIQSKNTLTHLNLSRCEHPDDELEIFSNLKNLEQLILLNVSYLNVNLVTSVAHHCTKLNHFAYTNQDNEERQLPYHIFRELRYLNLKHLECDAVVGTENVIYGLGKNWTEMKHLDVGKGSFFSLLDFQEVKKFKKLEYFNILCIDNDLQSFINITSNCLELKELVWSYGGCSSTVIDKLTNLIKLEKLDFTGCYNLTGNLLSKLVNNCKNLVDLNLSSCKNVTAASLIEVGKLQYLKKLHLYGIKNVPNEMFYNLRKLEFLKCASCPSVTDEGILKVIDNCKKLVFLNVQRTGITVRILVHASNPEFRFRKLTVYVDKNVKDTYTANKAKISPYLEIHC